MLAGLERVADAGDGKRGYSLGACSPCSVLLIAGAPLWVEMVVACCVRADVDWLISDPPEYRCYTNRMSRAARRVEYDPG